MANRLKIYACSGIGDVELPKVTFDNYGTKTTDNTQAVNTILIRMNGCRVRLENRSLSDNERETLQAQLNVYKDCLDAARMYAGNDYALAAAGEEIQSRYGLNDDFAMWWKNTILPRNKYGLGTQNRTMVKTAIKRAKAISGIGELDWRDNEELTEYLTKGSEYFLYTFFSEAQLKRLPSVFRIKRIKQKQTYNYCKALFVDIYGSEEDMVDVIRDGIMQYFKGSTPEEICERIANGEKISGAEPISWTIEAIVAVVAACLSFLASVIVAICNAVSNSNKAKYAAVNQKTVEESIPNPDDWDKLNLGKTNTAGVSWLPLLAVGAGLLYFGRKNF